MGVYVYMEGYAHTDFGRGAAISLLMVLIVAVLSLFYVAHMVKMEDTP
jgi:ABC-type sugar transport system permease subunit